MLKKIPLRMRFTLVASLFLLVSCVTLTLLSNMSAVSMMEAVTVMPAMEDGSTPSLPLRPAEPTEEPYYQIFQQKTAIATIFIVLIGSVTTYFAAGYVLRPIHDLSNEVQKRNIENLGEPIAIPQSADEIQQLTISFNQMMADLRHSFLLQKEFSANAAHELRTPLTVMRAKLDVFALSKDINPETHEMVNAMSCQLERLSKLIEDLLWFSKDLPLEKVTPVPLYPLLCDVAEELSSLADEKEIHVQIGETGCFVFGQDSLLERVFYNLLENAVKYSPPQTQVTVTVQKDLDSVRVRIADQGEGIPESCRDAVFDPFFRVDKSRSRAVGGSGLGLAVCKKILERHHAQISVLPNRPSGSIFEIRFPS